jgi:cytochrome c-type biogenesis protein CcmF
VLTSVHAFASDPTRGVFILCILLIFIGGALSLFALRAPVLASGGLFAPISREGALVLNNLILTVACGTVLTGTLYPLALETLNGDTISVGPPFFNMTFGLLMTPLLVAVPFGPLLAWKRGDLLGAMQRLYVAALLAFVAGVVLFYVKHGGPVLSILGLAAGFFLIFGAIADLWFRSGMGKVATNVAWRRLSGLPRSTFGTALAHAGFGVTVLGIVAVTTFQSENITQMKPGATAEIGGYTLRFDGMQAGVGPNFTEDRGHFTVMRGGVAVAEISSAKRLFTARRSATTEAGILTFGASQLYVSLGDQNNDGSMVVRIWWKPFIICIWGGAIIMALGGLVSLSDRRLRIGAPSRRAKAAKAVIPPVAEPAE